MRAFGAPSWSDAGLGRVCQLITTLAGITMTITIGYILMALIVSSGVWNAVGNLLGLLQLRGLIRSSALTLCTPKSVTTQSSNRLETDLSGPASRTVDQSRRLNGQCTVAVQRRIDVTEDQSSQRCFPRDAWSWLLN